jgi:hypothetical protein
LSYTRTYDPQTRRKTLARDLARHDGGNK